MSKELTGVQTIAQRLAQLDAYAAQNPGKPVSEHLLELVPELAELQEFGIALMPRQIPSQPPALWKTDRLPDESAPAFAERVYGETLADLCLADFRHLDPPLYKALENYKFYYHGMPDGFQLKPTLPDRYNRWIDSLANEGSDEPSEKLKLARKLLHAADRRLGTEHQPKSFTRTR